MTTTWWPYLRIAAAVLAVAAIVAQLIRSLEIAGAATTEWGAHLPTVIANFFSFFTIESNVLAAVALACGGIWGLARRSTTTAEPRWLAILLMCASTYMIVTGVVYNLLLRGIELPQGSTVGWSNEVLHVVIPIIMLADVLFAPRRRALGWGAVGIAAIFPIVWVIYTLIRANLVIAPATGKPYWYPYPFLDPTQTGGYVGVSLYVLLIAAIIIGAAALVVWVGRRRATVSDSAADATVPPADLAL
ncbi:MULTISPECIES: Pr6Pr family membrane protein [unclassified Microbacterium]|uniref:Pr6Pr family membrane protein n=1 Tax=unclassified Microbacterium TaxID=2609290 RepID=UPI0004938D29|nr:MULTISPECIES: Pr6Pr family membrane protein [unclassified Microbacterium]